MGFAHFLVGLFCLFVLFIFSRSFLNFNLFHSTFGICFGKKLVELSFNSCELSSDWKNSAMGIE